MVKGGGTFVIPVIEQAAVLSLEVFTVEVKRTNVRTGKGVPAQVEAVAQVKIDGDDASLARAAESLLSKRPDEISNIIRPLLEKHLRAVLGGVTIEALTLTVDKTAAAVTAAGGQIVEGPYDFPGGRGFQFTDPCGNQLAVWTPA